MRSLKAKYPDLATMDGYDEAIIGVVQRINLEVVCYDLDKVIQILMKQGMDEQDGDWYQFNMVGSWIGEQTPVFLERVTE
jgi:hypothetical protein